MKQANHAATSGQLKATIPLRPLLEEYWKRPHEPLPSLANVENTEDPAGEREELVPAHCETSESRLVHNNEPTLTYPTCPTPKSERDRESLKSLALIDEAVFSHVENEGFDEERE